jgi:hypothetical protein
MTQEPEIDPRKFTEYSMNPDHPDNKGKWMAFAALGYNVQSLEGREAAARDVMDQLRQGLPAAPSIPGQTSAYGTRFKVRLRIEGPNGTEGTLVTTWQIDRGKETPRLITNWLEVDR